MTQTVWSESDFPWLSSITEKWESIRDYALSRDYLYSTYRETHIYQGQWTIYGLRNTMTKWARSDRIMDPIFNLLPFQPFISTFSCLHPGLEIRPHTGFTDDVIRFHLGLVCPQNVGICIDGIDHSWEEGHWLIFNDRATHSVWNRGAEKRYVLIADFYRKDIGL